MSSVLASGLAVLCAVGVAVGVCSTHPIWRRHITVVAPVTLAFAALVVAGFMWSEALPSELRKWGIAGIAPWPVHLVVLLLSVAGARASFRAEAALLRWRPRANLAVPALPAQLIAVQLPGRADSMSGVRDMARQPSRFWALSALTVVAEETLYRMVLPAVLSTQGNAGWWCVALPAALYAVNHIGFGLRSVVGKFAFGIVLGLAALFGGALLAALPAHLMYQGWVRGQFAGSRARSGVT